MDKDHTNPPQGSDDPSAAQPRTWAQAQADFKTEGSAVKNTAPSTSPADAPPNPDQPYNYPTEPSTEEAEIIRNVETVEPQLNDHFADKMSQDYSTYQDPPITQPVQTSAQQASSTFQTPPTAAGTPFHVSGLAGNRAVNPDNTMSPHTFHAGANGNFGTAQPLQASAYRHESFNHQVQESPAPQGFSPAPSPYGQAQPQNPNTYVNNPYVAGRSAQPYTPYPQTRRNAVPQPRTDTLSVIALIAGIFSIIFSVLGLLFWVLLIGVIFFILGILLGIAATVMAAIALKKFPAGSPAPNNRNLALGGLVCGIIGLLLNIIFAAVCSLLTSAFFSNLGRLSHYMN